jgi:hypothetical protein
MSDGQSTVTYRDVPGFPGYRVGDDGSVWSRWGKGRCGLLEHWHRLRVGVDAKGYTHVVLCASGKRWTRKVHRLVLDLFVGERPDGQETRHLNGNRQDNRLSNIVYGTPEENWSDRFRHETDTSGERSAIAKVTADAVRAIRTAFDKGATYTELGREHGITSQAVRYIVLRKNWRHVL